MSNKVNENPVWVSRGKTIRQLIKELETFENQDLEVKISTDAGITHKSISLVGKSNESEIMICTLTNHEQSNT